VKISHTKDDTLALARTNVTLPAELLAEVDELAGPRGRSRYVADAVARQVKRDRQRKVFEATAGIMVGKPGWLNPDEALDLAKRLRAGWDRGE
jgi:hypothetical protein